MTAESLTYKKFGEICLKYSVSRIKVVGENRLVFLGIYDGDLLEYRHKPVYALEEDKSKVFYQPQPGVYKVLPKSDDEVLENLVNWL